MTDTPNETAADVERHITFTDPREVIVAAMGRAKLAGESHEMAARRIMEDLQKYGFDVVRND